MAKVTFIIYYSKNCSNFVLAYGWFQEFKYHVPRHDCHYDIMQAESGAP